MLIFAINRQDFILTMQGTGLSKHRPADTADTADTVEPGKVYSAIEFYH